MAYLPCQAIQTFSAKVKESRFIRPAVSDWRAVRSTLAYWWRAAAWRFSGGRLVLVMLGLGGFSAA